MSGINFTLLKELGEKPHPLLNIADDFEAQIRETPSAWIGEVFQHARNAHHLLDMAGIPRGEGRSSLVDMASRVAFTVNGRSRLGDTW